jgi:hypothetical protein
MKRFIKMTDRLPNPDTGQKGRIPPSQDGKLPVLGVLARSGEWGQKDGSGD